MKLPLYLTLFSLIAGFPEVSSQTFCTQNNTSRYAGEQDGYRYELWNENAQGTACMTLGDGALFSGEWNGVLNYLARRGLSYNQTQEHQDVGNFFSTYVCDYNPSGTAGNSYLSIYGWTVDPLIEFYIVEDWRNWIPSMDGGASSKGTITVNGSTYDIIENTRVNQPSIVGNTTFQQYFSIRRDTRTSGEINISDHFEKWESLGLDLGKLYEVSFVVEGYQSSGSFQFLALDIHVENGSDINHNELSERFNIFPNPAKDHITVKCFEQATVEIYNIFGQLMIQKPISDIENEIAIDHLSPGNYILKLIFKDTVKSSIIIVE